MLLGLVLPTSFLLVMTSWVPTVTSSLEKIENYHIQLRVYVDAKAFTFWKGITGKTDFKDYDTEIRSYFTEVQKAYDSLEEFNTVAITLEIVSLVLKDDDPLENPYIRGDSTAGLEAFRNSIYSDWKKEPYDMALLITGYHLGGTKVGYAFINRVCTIDSVAVVHQKSTDNMIVEIAHEIGHSLGAQHDNGQYADLDCYAQSGQIMNPSIHKFKKGRFSFSSCSNSDFEHNLRALKYLPGKTDCLKDGKGKVSDTRLGALIPPDEYCKRNNLGGYFVSRKENHKYRYAQICDYLSCYEKDGQKDHLMVALQGMQCGKNKVCNRAVCEESYDGSPFVTDACPLGDQPLLPPNYDRSCNDIDPSECSKYEVECCLTCNKTNPILTKTADEVCQELAGPKHVMLRSSHSDGDGLCSQLTCDASTDGRKFDKQVFRAPNGMACGKNKRCSWGKCVATKSGNPDIPDECPYGDQDLQSLGYKGSCEKYSKGDNCSRWGTTCCKSCKSKQ